MVFCDDCQRSDHDGVVSPPIAELPHRGTCGRRAVGDGASGALARFAGGLRRRLDHGHERHGTRGHLPVDATQRARHLSDQFGATSPRLFMEIRGLALADAGLFGGDDVQCLATMGPLGRGSDSVGRGCVRICSACRSGSTRPVGYD